MSENGKIIIERIPLGKLLIETDGPFIKIQDRNSNPTDASLIFEQLIKIKNISNNDITKGSFIEENFRELIL